MPSERVEKWIGAAQPEARRNAEAEERLELAEKFRALKAEFLVRDAVRFPGGLEVAG